MSDEINGWLMQVTGGDPRDGDQTVDMYAAWVPSEDEAAQLVLSTYSLAEDQVVAPVDTLEIDIMTKLGLQPGQVCPFVEETD